MAGFLAVLGGAMSGLGSGLVENARAKREAAIEAMKEARADARAKAEREFTAGQNQNAIDARAKESALDREARASEASLGREAEDARTKATLDFQREGRGDLVTLADGTPGVRVGDTWRPLKTESGESVTLKSDKWRTLTADEAASLGLPADKSFQVGPDGEIKQIGGGGTTVNVGAGEKAWDTESAKLFAKRYDDITGGAMNAEQMLGMYDLAEQALKSGVRTGVGAEAELTLRQFGAALGLDTDAEKLAGGELIRAIQNRMALTMRSPDGGMGMPGALSDRDIKFLKDSQVGIDRSPEGNLRMLKAFRAMEGRKIEIARLADQYIEQNGRLDSGFNKMIREFAEANPLFGDGPDGPPAAGGRAGKIQWRFEP